MDIRIKPRKQPVLSVKLQHFRTKNPQIHKIMHIKPKKKLFLYAYFKKSIGNGEKTTDLKDIIFTPKTVLQQGMSDYYFTHLKEFLKLQQSHFYYHQQENVSYIGIQKKLLHRTLPCSCLHILL